MRHNTRGIRFLLRTISFGAMMSMVAAGCADTGDPDPAPDEEASANPQQPGFTIDAGESYPSVQAESHLRNVRQLTFDGENAEAYFSPDGTRLIFQRTANEAPEGAAGGIACDRIYTMDLATGDTALVSTGTGRTTCSYFYPGGDRIIYASTHHVAEQCPAPPNMAQGYVWAVYPSYDLWVADDDGSNLTQLTDTEGYDAEATISPLGDRMIFTSVRNGDLDLYTMNLDGTDVRQVTDRAGYDGGAFFSPDGSRIVWRADYPEGSALEDYQRLLDQGLIRPNVLEIYVANADGTGVVQVTDNGAANFGPYWHPDGERIIFSSNLGDPDEREFDLYMINADGTGLEQITFTGDFDGFPMFSPDGRYLVWGSNRNPSHAENTNVFIAEWVEG